MLLLMVVVVWAVASCVIVAVRISLNEVAKNQIVAAMQARYPNLQFKAGNGGYDKAAVRLRVRGAHDSNLQQEVKKSLSDLKARQHINVEIWLRFDDGDLGDYDSVIKL